MRKRITPAVSVRTALQGEWLDLEGLAEVQVTSEDPANPIEAALLPGNGEGWRAATLGTQTIRIVFDNPQNIAHIHLIFVEERVSRTQEFVLRWAQSTGAQPTEILRQQFNFTPVASEVEEYAVNLAAVKVLELEITPAVDRPANASLTELRLR